MGANEPSPRRCYKEERCGKAVCIGDVFLPMAFGPTMWTNPVEKQMNVSGKKIQAKNCAATENCSSSNMNWRAVKRRSDLCHTQNDCK